MKKYILSSWILAGVVLLTGCEQGLDGLNDNPNQPTADMYDFNKSTIGTVLRYGVDMNFTLNGGLVGAAHLHERIKNLNIDFYSQYINPSGGWTTRNYTPNGGWNGDYWKAHYQWLSTLNTVIAQGKDNPMAQNGVALARVWRVYIQSQATDFFGPIPFPKSPAEANPAYESLEAQYNFFFAELDAAVKQFSPGKDFLTAEDPIYFGDITKWKQFANSLRLRLALKVSEVNPQLCKAQAEAAFAAGVMQQGNDAKIAGTTGWGNAYNYYMYQVGWGEKMVMTSSFQKILTGIGGVAYAGSAETHPSDVDPRGSIYFDPSVTGKKWVGVYPGLPTGEHVNIGSTNAYMSEVNILSSDKRKIDLFLYPEVCFMLAEAAERGFIATDAKTWYENGVKASFAAWNAGNVNSYLASNAKNAWGTSASYDDATGAGNTKLEKIITQKYIANFPDVSLQAWNDKRRLNLPAFDVPKERDPGAGTFPATFDIKDPKNFISRQIFPQSESLNNQTNYNAGVQLLGGADKVSTNVWWDKDKNYCTSSVQ
ncbi:SusD/RagB family nutrient-binding outer membrane lipoprotein [Solitalea longa]|uniref:SusD/RagB family nutrient-binding outer membrane lipoprotein n=1 Tax=Solitalea longa TaxID=2079460 RepID=A0A2S5A3E3_9SPHI|nr:SusD/RagB family nutrient-binding outer membrane lipoprotein [Solitalea longa]POY37056.1 SusD/RagB family nutrient-binding outer membrane lipoprotein [Solitalea longa]